MIIDTHLHLDDRIQGSPDLALNELSKQLENSNIEKAIVIHLENQRWSKEVFINSILKNQKLSGFVNINPNNTKSLNEVSIGDSIINVDSTVGFGATGTLISGNNTIAITMATVGTSIV